jgi:ABC-type sugar transport system ATPase subunit
MVFQNYALYPHMTVFKNIAFPLEMAKKSKPEIEASVGGAAGILELDELLGRYPDQLSGGQRQRVALARALVREPQAFLMDEPLSNLDALLRVQTRVELMRLHQQLGTTTLYVTHDQVEAMTMGRRIAVMQNGVVQHLGSPSDVYSRPTNVFVATFIGSPPMNLLPGRLVQNGGGWTFQGEGFSVPISAEALGAEQAWMERAAGEGSHLGIRPEDLPILAPGAEGIGGRVQLLEPVGSDLFLTVEAGGTIMQVRAAPDAPVQVGDNLVLGLTPSKLHVFGGDGRSVRYAPEAIPASEPAIDEEIERVAAEQG